MSHCDYLPNTPLTEEKHHSLMLDVVNQPNILTYVNTDSSQMNSDTEGSSRVRQLKICSNEIKRSQSTRPEGDGSLHKQQLHKERIKEICYYWVTFPLLYWADKLMENKHASQTTGIKKK